MRAQSIAGRLAIMFGLAAALVSTIAGIALYALQATELRRHKMEELAGRFIIVERMAQHNGDAAKWSRFTEKLNDFTPPDNSLRFIVESPDPRFRFSGDFLARASMTGPRQGFGRAEMDGRPYLTLSKLVPPLDERPQVRLIIAIGRSDVDRAQWVLALGILIVSILAILAVAGLGWWIARRGLAPVDRLSDHARRLGGGDLSLRLPTATLPSELGGLVLALNEALDRLQQSYVQLSTFNADVAHELRTPLANLIGETQVALSRDRSAGEFEAVLQSNLEELERLRSIINDMLFLARADQGDLAANLAEVSLAAETRKSADFMEMLFEEAGTTLLIQGDARARVERALYGLAITNLLDNAVRHGDAGGTVIVAIEDRAGDVAIGVRSPGAPIDPDQFDRIFDRFYRIDPVRPNSKDSHGLGLAIVKAIAQMHGGSVFARSQGGEILVGLTIAKGLDPAVPGLERGRQGRSDQMVADMDDARMT
ncbi:histidine kinase [Sphingomonas oleivorans]|uniref:Sensor protein n=1 Tax=Sphingomonas oleivorans TaxID=1735121 RepID=A0A2T5FTN9_9SPHN|nr:heavy metal sensor histidine kinase [Sphingomonas oleivorans]PTQ07437.1 histidine kinase [Sphingomonas oleivorans]